jgi:hypothetical protein
MKTPRAPISFAGGQLGEARQVCAFFNIPLPVEGELPSLSGATGWLNSPHWVRSVCAEKSF